MAPAFRPGQLVFAKPYGRRPPRRGDVVAFRYPPETGKVFIKRIARLPREPLPGTATPLGTDEHYLLGDHQADSFDSRALGPIPSHVFLGRVWLRLWPFRMWR